MNTLFPVFLKLDQLETLVVGGGNVGLEKLQALLSNSPLAKVTVVAPEIKNEIAGLAYTHSGLKLLKRPFEWADLEQKDMVICASDNKELHHGIYRECKKRKILINVADTPDLCDFYMSSIVKKGDLKLAISTNGKSPTFAKRLKEMLTEVLAEDELNELMANLNAYRESLRGDFNDKVKKLNDLTKGLSGSGETVG